MKIYIAHSSNFPFREKLYAPLRASELNARHEIFLPQETGNEDVTRELIKSQNLVIAEVSMPSTGSGIELGWADAAGVPILCIYEKGAKYSSSLDYVCKNFVEYSGADDMLQKISAFIQQI